MSEVVTYRIEVKESVGGDASERERLATDLEDFLRQSDADVRSLERQGSSPTAMSLGDILIAVLATKNLEKFVKALKSWLGASRAEIEVTCVGGRKIKVSASNADDTLRLLERARDC